jgi:hypothetical protein
MATHSDAWEGWLLEFHPVRPEFHSQPPKSEKGVPTDADPQLCTGAVA